MKFEKFLPSVRHFAEFSKSDRRHSLEYFPVLTGAMSDLVNDPVHRGYTLAYALRSARSGDFIELPPGEICICTTRISDRQQLVIPSGVGVLGRGVGVTVLKIGEYRGQPNPIIVGDGTILQDMTIRTFVTGVPETNTLGDGEAIVHESRKHQTYSLRLNNVEIHTHGNGIVAAGDGAHEWTLLNVADCSEAGSQLSDNADSRMNTRMCTGFGSTLPQF